MARLTGSRSETTLAGMANPPIGRDAADVAAHGQPRPGPFDWALLALIAVMGLYTAFALSAGTRRTAEAPATIVSAEPQQLGSRETRPGFRIQYRFASADGSEHGGDALQPWTQEQVRSSKVCYEPGDPSNAELVLAGVSCPT